VPVIAGVRSPRRFSYKEGAVDCEYFIEDGKFKVRRFPSSKSPVKIKDCTDLQDIRSELRGLSSIEECIEAYEFYFNDQEWYEVEVETFEELFERREIMISSKSLEIGS